MHEKTHKASLWDFKWNSSHFNSHQYTFSTYLSISMWLPLFGIFAFEVLGSYYVIQLHFALDNNEKCTLMFFWEREKERKKLNITSLAFSIFFYLETFERDMEIA